MSLAPELLTTPPLPFATLRGELDGRIAVARYGPLDAGAREAITRQAELLAPAKLALSAQGDCELCAEVLRSGGLDAPKLARSAIDVGRAWLAGEAPGASAIPPDPDDLASALAELPRAWAWERGEADRFRVHATAFGESVRLAVDAVPGGARVTARSALATPDPAAGDALAHFALDSNRRLRLARIGLAGTNGDATAVTWDVVTPPGMDLASVLPAAVEAVVRAHAATRRSLRALCHGQIARLYLHARGPTSRWLRDTPEREATG
jgi:hypothetical protein